MNLAQNYIQLHCFIWSPASSTKLNFIHRYGVEGRSQTTQMASSAMELQLGYSVLLLTKCSGGRIQINCTNDYMIDQLQQVTPNWLNLLTLAKHMRHSFSWLATKHKGGILCTNFEKEEIKGNWCIKWLWIHIMKFTLKVFAAFFDTVCSVLFFQVLNLHIHSHQHTCKELSWGSS